MGRTNLVMPVWGAMYTTPTTEQTLKGEWVDPKAEVCYQKASVEVSSMPPKRISASNTKYCAYGQIDSFADAAKPVRGCSMDDASKVVGQCAYSRAYTSLPSQLKS